MSTWHQDKRPVKLYHATKWTVVIDPPHACRAIARFDQQAAAEQYLSNIRERGEQHAYIVRPDAGA
jgi:hypothetical protein